MSFAHDCVIFTPLRLLYAVVSFTLSAVAAFFIWFLDSKIGIIMFEAVFSFVFISGWNALDIATTECYPAHIRYVTSSIVWNHYL